MSVVAWDGETLAADRRVCFGNLYRTTTKVFKFDSVLAAYVGDSSIGEEVLAWFRNGGDVKDFPSAQRDKDGGTELLIVWPNKVIWTYGRTPHPVKLHPQKFANGSGRDFALAAMHCGKTATEAVEIACLFDIACGNGIDALRHGEEAYR